MQIYPYIKVTKEIRFSRQKFYQPSQIAVKLRRLLSSFKLLKAYSRRVAAVDFISYAHVGIAKQRPRTISKLGVFRRKDHAPGVFSCPPHADRHMEALAVLDSGARKVKITEF